MNKKLSVLTSIFFVSISLTTNAFAENATLELKTKLAKFDAFKSHFIQKIYSPTGALLNEGKGFLIISRPGKVIWKITEPEPEEIISDGKTVWFYTPFIDQVTILDYKTAISGSPFMLLAGAEGAQWNDYLISKEKNKFTIKNKKETTHSSTFTITFDKSEHLSAFENVEASGQRSNYTFKTDVKYTKPAASIFEFKIPKGVEVDDQR